MLFWNPGSYHGESIGRNHITLRMIDDGGDLGRSSAIGAKQVKAASVLLLDHFSSLSDLTQDLQKITNKE